MSPVDGHNAIKNLYEAMAHPDLRPVAFPRQGPTG